MYVYIYIYIYLGRCLQHRGDHVARAATPCGSLNRTQRPLNRGKGGTLNRPRVAPLAAGLGGTLNRHARGTLNREKAWRHPQPQA